MDADPFTDLAVAVCDQLANEKAETVEKKKRKRLHVTTAWTTENVLTLLSAIEIYPCIWEYSSAEYKNRQKRDDAWRNVAESCAGHTIDECKAKWANVKTAYTNVKKKLTSKSGQGVLAVPHWPFWNAMSFYFHHDCAKTTSSVSNVSFETDSQPLNATPPDVSKTLNSKSAPSSSMTKTPDEVLECAFNLLNDSKEDHWTTFGLYLASQLRTIEEKDKNAANDLHLDILKKTVEVLSKVNNL